MTDQVDFTPSKDPLYRGVLLDQVVEIPVVGLSVRFETNSRHVLGVVNEAFGEWARYQLGDAHSPGDRLRVRIIVHDVGPTSAERTPVAYRVPDPDRLLLQTSGTIGVADLNRGEAVAYVSPAVAGDRAHFRYTVVEGLTLPLVCARDRQPLHAAAIGKGGAALVLAGVSGVGKSTITYAAARAGWEVIAEDELFLQLSPRFRVWGKPGPIHLPADTRRHFSELADGAPSLLANGKRKLAVRPPPQSPRPSTPMVERATVCLLERGSAPRTPERIPAAEVERVLGNPGEAGFDVYAGTIGQRVRELARHGGWRVTVAGEPADVLPGLDEILRTLR